MPDLILASSVTIEVTGPAPVVWEQVEPSPVTVGVGSHLLIPGPPGPQGLAGVGVVIGATPPTPTGAPVMWVETDPAGLPVSLWLETGV